MSKIFYRPHRELFADAMAERKSFTTVTQVVDYVINSYPFGKAALKRYEVSFRYYCYDSRLKSDSFIVINERDGFPLGFMEFGESEE
jgi:hypothetical protein